MFSNNFLTCYCFFTAAVTAYRGAPQDVRNLNDDKSAAIAFKKATAGMSKAEQTSLLLFLLRLIQQPEQFSRNNDYRNKLESALDREIAKQFPEIVNADLILDEPNFLARAGITKEKLSQKIRDRRIFSIPHWIHKDLGEEHYPAFFVDPQYDQSLLETVSMALRASPGERKYRFFITPDMVLGNRTPLELLALGEVEIVVDRAKAFRKRTSVPLKET
nr:hypothetical protein [uncultured Noviherbaspirillum sp.]